MHDLKNHKCHINNVRGLNTSPIQYLEKQGQAHFGSDSPAFHCPEEIPLEQVLPPDKNRGAGFPFCANGIPLGQSGLSPAKLCCYLRSGL